MLSVTQRLFAVALLSCCAHLGFAQAVFINEIHYDNLGNPDTDEGVEIAGPAGTDLSSYSLVLYNGANGDPYKTEVLAGTLPDQQDGFGTLWFSISPIQNGAPDGIALLQGATVVQFLSYEGTFVAASGPASGLTSTDIGVAESGSEAPGLSLALTGTGSTYGDFSWQAPSQESRGAINTGQVFTVPAITNLKISAIVDSLVANCDGTYTAFFGYLNRNNVTITIPVGSDNRFSPLPQDRGQTTDFLPGRQRNVFAVTFPQGTNLVWTLKSPNGQQTTATAGGNFPNITQTPCFDCNDPASAPSYAGGYVLNNAGSRAFLHVMAPAGGTSFEFYNMTNLVVGAPEADAESGTLLSGVTRAGDTFTFNPASPADVYFPIATAGNGSGIRFFLRVTDTCGRTVDVDPAFTLTGVAPEALTGFALSGAQPNPAATQAVVRFSLEAAGPVRLSVYDVLGREVARLLDGPMAAGPQQAVLEAGSLSAGLYVLRLRAGDRVLSQTVTIAR